MDHRGYSFCIKRSCPETSTVYYVCKRFREGCKAKITVRSVVWQGVYDGIKRLHAADDVTLTIIPCAPAVSIVKQTRKECTGGDVYEAILAPSVRCVSDKDPRSILQFSVAYLTHATT
ncbi:hypothetical protein F443_02291 [Phytophthora nicotianae P1569]|uniref:FLYWCH-type domain-containing protein n=1 Tax=Phytophthora nicotianae P1569 TaxID=1317065 RepID=V9FW51_PHYNI|nr:hypothetical protein F443_02291 [Phytophthora nicotianae P1569]